MSRYDQIGILMPAYDPEPVALEVVRGLSEKGFRHIVVVNDGSAKGHGELFDRMAEVAGVTLLNHDRNRGKGAALKTGFRHYLAMPEGEVAAVVTVDADGQHAIEDILRVSEAAWRNPDSLVLGTRTFGEGVPWRSKLGNRVTRLVLRGLAGIDVADSQTGLRGLPLSFTARAVEIARNRYDFELDCLILAQRGGVPLLEVPIHTIYFAGNRASHFRPFMDSARIYFVFSRFVAVSGLSFCIDLLGFTLVQLLLGDVFLSTYLARVVSGVFNFLANKFSVFRSYSARGTAMEMLLYFCLAVLIATASGSAVSLVGQMDIAGLLLVKIVVDVQLFVISFLAQRFFIFRNA